MDNNTERSPRRRWPVARTGLTIVAVYAAAMIVLVLARTGAIADDAWTHVGMAGALAATLGGSFFGYALAVTAEAPKARGADERTASHSR